MTLQRQNHNPCQYFHFEELASLVHHLWPANQDGATKISYTFDQNGIPQGFKEKLSKEFPDLFITPITHRLKSSVEQVLAKWVNACGSRVTFNYHETVSQDFRGIIFQACDFPKKYSKNGLSLSYHSDYRNVRSFPEVELNVLCIPSGSTYFDLHTISHEIGHGLGLAHFHDVESVRQRLKDYEQGQGCSVMPYSNEIRGDKSNQCRDLIACEKQGYAIYPGELDAIACQTLYNPNHTFFAKRQPKAAPQLNMQASRLSQVASNAPASALILLCLFLLLLFCKKGTRATHRKAPVLGLN